MLKVFWLVLSLSLVSLNSHAVEPVLDQQVMFYFNMTFDTGTSVKSEHDFGFRLDRTLMQSGDTIMLNQLTNKPAVFNLKFNDNVLKSFELNGVDYSEEYFVARADGEIEAEAEAQPKKEINIPLGVYIGALIGGIAIASSGD